MKSREFLIRWFLRNTTKDREELAEYSTEDLADIYETLKEGEY